MKNMKRLDVLIERLHKNAIQETRGFYIDPSSGLQVYTSQYLRDRGYCCNTGCRHCPY